MLVNSFMNKSLTKFLISLLFALFTLPTSNAMEEKKTENDMLELNPFYNELDPVVHDAAYALRQLMSYYKLWYRCKYNTN